MMERSVTTKPGRMWSWKSGCQNCHVANMALVENVTVQYQSDLLPVRLFFMVVNLKVIGKLSGKCMPVHELFLFT